MTKVLLLISVLWSVPSFAHWNEKGQWVVEFITPAKSCSAHLPDTTAFAQVAEAALLMDRIGQGLTEHQAEHELDLAMPVRDTDTQIKVAQAATNLESRNFDWRRVEEEGTHIDSYFAGKLPFVVLKVRNQNWLVQGILKSPGQMPQRIAKALMDWPSLWTSHPQAKEVVAKITSTIRIKAFGPWVLWVLRKKIVSEEFVKQEALKRIKNWDFSHIESSYLALQLLHVFKLQELPENAIRGVGEWVDFTQGIPASVAIETLQALPEAVGSCPEMAWGHLSVLNSCAASQFNQQPHALIYLNSELVGVLKRVGDKSMLALRNIANPQGKLILAAGGVYELPKSIVQTISSSNQRKFNLSKLEVHPVSFLFNSKAFEGNPFENTKNPSAMRTAMKDYLDAQTLNILDSLMDDPMEPDSQERKILWQTFLKALEGIRKKLLEPQSVLGGGI